VKKWRELVIDRERRRGIVRRAKDHSGLNRQRKKQEEEEEEELLIKNIMRVFDNERIRRIFGPKREGVPCERKLYN
jgi:hypothetical protein